MLHHDLASENVPAINAAGATRPTHERRPAERVGTFANTQWADQEWKESDTWPESAVEAGETGDMVARPEAWGDVILARKETPTSYHLSVVIDDALQGVTDVVRGADLFWSTSVHRLLQELLGTCGSLCSQKAHDKKNSCKRVILWK